MTSMIAYLVLRQAPRQNKQGRAEPMNTGPLISRRDKTSLIPDGTDKGGVCGSRITAPDKRRCISTTIISPTSIRKIANRRF